MANLKGRVATSIDDLPALRRDQEGPVFREPWEAQAFALALQLAESGCFTWSEWVEVLSQEIQTAQGEGDADLGDTYYRHWLNALERICVEKGLLEHQDMRRRKEEWRLAYLHTPHGKPIELAAAFKAKD